MSNEKAQTMRIDKLLADCGLGSRKELREIIKRGRVCVNGTVVSDAGQQVSSYAVVLLDGAEVRWQKTRVYLMNKPSGVLTATRDPKAHTVLDLLTAPESKMDLFPVGRLDKDTEGLLLLTNDGALSHALTAPKKGVPKCYEAVVDAPPDANAELRFHEGIPLDEGVLSLPATLERRGDELYQGALCPVVRVVVCEGKYHQVKRMLYAVGSEVLHLRRLSLGPLTLDPALAPGAYRPLTDEELAALLALMRV